MNKLFKKAVGGRSHKDKMKGLVISIVILVEVIAILTVATFAWVETVSSIKIATQSNAPGTIDTYVFTDVMIGKQEGTVDLGGYFKQSGNMHLAPASCADGLNIFFPKVGATNVYRRGNSSDKNTAYLSVSFRLKADTNCDFFFNQVPTVDNRIRVSVTAYSEGMSSGDLYDAETGAPKYTKIYANSASTGNVVNSTNGGVGATSVEAFNDHIKGKGSTKRLFAVGANETKIVTVNVWLQVTQSSDITSSMSATQSLTNLALTSSLTPRHVTLLPTPTWDVSNITQYFYAWCWGATNGDASRLYQLQLDDNEHYSFDYNGTFQNTLFFRSGVDNLKTADMNANNNAAWTNGTIWNKTEDTSIPNDPVDPTFIIETINGSSEIDTSSGNNSTAKKSTGSWHDPATIKVAYVTGQSDSWGTLSATSYVGTTTSTHVIEATNSGSQKHKDTIHAWPGKKLKLTATPGLDGNNNAAYAFVGWYNNPAGTGTALSTNATYEPNAPATASEVTYYAKFKEVRKISLYQYLDGSTSTAAGSFSMSGPNNATSTGTNPKTIIVDKGASVTLSVTPNSGYNFTGFFNVPTNGTALSGVTTSGNTKSVNITASSANYNTNYYARFTTNSYTVTTHAYYSTNNGTSYTSDNSTGGTVKTGDASAGATSAKSIKYKTSVTLTAAPETGYRFAGWFSSTSATSALSTNTTYSYTLNTAGDVDIYARFIYAMYNVTANAYYSTNGGSSYSSGSTGGTVKAGSAAAGATSTQSVLQGNSVSLVASPASGYEFVGWYSAASGGTQLSTDTTYSYTLSASSNQNVYARFIRESWSISYGVSGASSWSSQAMTVNNNTITGSMTLTEGQDFSFQIVKTVGSTSTWYGGGGSYSNITSTSFISNKTLSVDGGDIYMKGHAGTYTFTFNKSTKVLNVTVSYSNITITFDYSDQTWWGNDSAVISFYDGSGESNMSNGSGNTKTLSISSARGNSGSVGFNRWKDTSHSEHWNNANAGPRGYSTTYKVGSGWQ